jgi:hypothetical protein
VARVVTAANVNDTLVLERLFLTAFAVMARIRTVLADEGYDAERHRDLCLAPASVGNPCCRRHGELPLLSADGPGCKPILQPAQAA